MNVKLNPKVVRRIRSEGCEAGAIKEAGKEGRKEGESKRGEK